MALTRTAPPPHVDLELAGAQHAGYAATLRRIGLEVFELPSDDLHPDSVFVQDRACVLDGRAIVSRSAVASRSGEEAPIVDILRRSLPVAALQAPACLDWGDVLAAEGTLFVGMSERSNRTAVDQLRVMLAPRWTIEAVALPSDLLHLLSGCAYLGDEALLALNSLDEFARAHGFRRVPVPAHEALAANALVLGEDVIVPAGNPETEASIARLGRRVHPVPVSEFEKRDGGVTCLSVLY